MTSEIKAFIIDDDAAVRESLTSLLDLEGFETTAFGDGESFLRDIDRSATGVALVDVNLPDVNGLELQKRLVLEYPGLVVIIITGHGNVPMAVSAIKSGAADFIEKPFSGNIVLDTVRRALADARGAVVPTQPSAEVLTRIDSLTPREREVLTQLVIGNRNKIIAYELGISPRTVEIYRAKVMEKMKADNLSHLIRMALSAGIGSV